MWYQSHITTASFSPSLSLALALLTHIYTLSPWHKYYMYVRRSLIINNIFFPWNFSFIFSLLLIYSVYYFPGGSSIISSVLDGKVFHWRAHTTRFAKKHTICVRCVHIIPQAGARGPLCVYYKARAENHWDAREAAVTVNKTRDSAYMPL